MRPARTIVAAVAVALSLVACNALSGLRASRPDVLYVQGDRATYEAVAPVVRALSDEDPANDPDLSGVNGRAMLELMDSWDLRIRSAESDLGVAPADGGGEQ